MRLRAVCCALFCSIVLPITSTRAQETAEPPPVGVDQSFDTQARAIAEQLRCPVCLGNSIQDSPSELAQDMRQLVREQLAAGRSEAEIKEYFVARYGEWVLLNPSAQGFNLVVWLLPAVLLVGGGVVVWRAVNRWTRAGDSGRSPAGVGTPGVPPPVEDEYLRKVRDEVAGKRE